MSMADRPAFLERLTKTIPGTATFVLGLVLCTAVGGMIGLSHRSLREWQSAAELLAEQRSEVMLTLLANALNQDMKGAQLSVLLPLEYDDVIAGVPDDLRDTVARAFPRFPYAESFFAWTPTASQPSELYVFNRTDRRPAWDPGSNVHVSYPVTVEHNPQPARPLLAALRAHEHDTGRFGVFEWTHDGIEYQVVAKRIVARGGAFGGFVGFTVNLPWARHHYFGELVQEVSQIGDVTRAAAITVADERGQPVASTRPSTLHGPLRQRQFPLLFFDPAMLSTLAPVSKVSRFWTIQVEAINDPALVGAVRGSYRTYILLGVAAPACVLGLLFTARAIRAAAALAAMQSDFTSTVTHELKTPLTAMRLLGETLSSERHHSTSTIRDYAAMLSQEAWRLTLLIDNLLTYARVPSSKAKLALERLDVMDLVDDTIQRFRLQLIDRKFDVTVDIQHDLPHVRGDRVMVSQALANLVDNAIKYSGDERVLIIRSWANDGVVVIDVADRGAGIAQTDMPRVFEKFYRGRGTRTGGSGLGLAIVKRVMEDHQGSVDVTSAPGQGTAVRLTLPKADDA